MTERELKDFFEKVRRARGMANELAEQRTQLRSDAVSIKAVQYDKDKVTSGNTSDLSDVIIRLEEKLRKLDAEYLEEMDKLLRMRLQAQDYLKYLDDVDRKYSRVLTKRYMNNMPWDHVAEEVSYTVDYCWHLRDDAISHIVCRMNKSD